MRNLNNGGAAPQPSKTTMGVMASPAGKGFMAKFSDADAVLKPVQEQVVIAILPGVLRNFGETAEASEAERRAAEGLPLSKAIAR